MVIMRQSCSVIAVVLLLTSACYGNIGSSLSTSDTSNATVRIVDTTPKSFWNYMSDISASALVIFTIVLVIVTGYYAIQTKRSVEVSKELLASNKELIEINKAQNNIAKNQLLSKIDELISTRRLGEGFPIDSSLGVAIHAYLNKTAIELLGECYTKKVTIRLRSDHIGRKPVFNRQCDPGKTVIISMIEWERLKEVDHDFEFVGYELEDKERLNG